MTKTRSILVVGAEGMLGSVLAARLEAAGTIVWRTSRRPPSEDDRHLALDLAADPASWRLPSAPPSAAILCAGVTSIERCREEPDRTARINVHGTIALARVLAAGGTFVIFPSSNMVFDGVRPHRRQDESACPRTEYGRQKALVEQELRALGRSAAVVRFAKILGPGMPLIRGWIDALLAGAEIRPFFDMAMAPVTHTFAAEVLERIAERRLSGLFQVSARQDVSYAEVARHLARQLAVSAGLVVPVSAGTQGLASDAIPAHTTLDGARLRSTLGLERPDAWDAVDAAFDLIYSGARSDRGPGPQRENLLRT